MKKALAIAVLLAVAVSTASYGASARWQALGNDHRFMYDTSNYGIYPGLMYKFSDALWIIPTGGGSEDMLAGLLVKKNDWAWAIHYNLPGTVAFGDLKTALGTAPGSLPGLVGSLKPVPDFFLAKKSGDKVFAGRVVLGLASSEPVADKSASAMSIDLAGGVTMPTSMGDLDLGVRLSKASFSDDSGAAKIENSGGMGVHVDVRLMQKCGEDTKMIPILNLRYKTLPVVKNTGADTANVGATLGLGMNRQDKDKRMLVAAVVVDVDQKTASPFASGAKDTKTRTIGITYLTGYEYPVNSWLVARGGANAKLTMIGGDAPSTKGSALYYNFGVRGIYKKVLLDLLIDRTFFQRGPYILSGQNANLANNVCLTYMF